MSTKRIITLCSESTLSGQNEQQSQYSGYSQDPKEAFAQVSADITCFIGSLQNILRSPQNVPISTSTSTDFADSNKTNEEKMNILLDQLNLVSQNMKAKQIPPEK